jgi:TolB-like protein/Tfp pilus assembly protein PilF
MVHRPAVRVWHAAREYFGHWMVAGAILAITGSAPEHWFADLLHEVHLPAEILHLGAWGIDLRLIVVCAGFGLIAGEVSWRHLQRQCPPAAAANPAIPASSTQGLPDNAAAGAPSFDRPPQAIPAILLAPVDAAAPSIAVLPFIDLSEEKNQEYFADGLAEELLNILARVRGLRVASRTSAFYFKGRNVDLATVAQKLNVATILEGGVRKSGNRLRVSAQLVQVATDSHLWSDTYDRELTDIFAVQREIAQSVVKELRAALRDGKQDGSASVAAEADVQAAAKGRGDNAESYRRYLQGLYFEDRLTRGDNAKAIGHFRQAVEIDPAFALGWAGLSRAYANVARFSWGSIGDSFRNARAAAKRALELEPDLADGHAALGLVRMQHDWDWPGAGASFQRALDLAPGDAQVIRATGLLAGTTGQLDRAVSLLRHAAMLDPLSAETHRRLARWCIYADLPAEGEAAARTALELNPGSGLSHYWHGLAQLAQGRHAEASEAFRHEVHDTFRLLGLALVHSARGDSAQAEAALQELITRDSAGSACQIAEGYAYQQKVDLAFQWLEHAYAARDPGLTFSKADVLLKNLREDPRWRPFQKKMGLLGTPHG